MKTVDIIIPTYNRKLFLVKNLQFLINFIHELKAEEYISIYISDNCSTDETTETVQKMIKETDVHVELYTQKKNIGSINNFKFLVKSAKAEYLMLLGDDDYINVSYLKKVINYLNSAEMITAIIPNCYNTATWKYRTPIGEDIVLEYPKSLKLILFATQMSGLVFQRLGLSEELERQKICNNYLSVFFVGYSAQKGRTVHIRSNPIEITIPEKRPWEYSKDMFFDDFCENFVFLGISYFRRAYYEMHSITVDAVSYAHMGMKGLFKLHSAMLKGKNITGLTKIFFPIYICVGIVKGVIRRLRFMLSPNKEKYIHDSV